MPGFPIRTSSDPRSVDSSPRHIAASHVLHRLSMPRHPPCALTHLQTQKPRNKKLQKQTTPANGPCLLDARNHYPQNKHHTPPPRWSDNNPPPTRGITTGLLPQDPTVCPAQKPATRNPQGLLAVDDLESLLLFVKHLHHRPPTTGAGTTSPNHHFPHGCRDGGIMVLLRKEVIQPHLPVRLPCYDFVPIADPTFDGSLPRVRPPASGVTDFHDVTGGVYKARERIHRSVADLRLLATPTSRGRVADPDPN